MEAVAKLRNCSISARKMRLVVDLVRGKSVDEALGILKFTKKEAAEALTKLLLSAIANWENKNNMTFNADEYDLYIKRIFADEGTMLKRIQPAPQGRAHRIRRRSCHVTLVIENRVPLDEITQDEELEVETLNEENE